MPGEDTFPALVTSVAFVTNSANTTGHCITETHVKTVKRVVGDVWGVYSRVHDTRGHLTGILNGARHGRHRGRDDVVAEVPGSIKELRGDLSGHLKRLIFKALGVALLLHRREVNLRARYRFL